MMPDSYVADRESLMDLESSESKRPVDLDSRSLWVKLLKLNLSLLRMQETAPGCAPTSPSVSSKACFTGSLRQASTDP